MKTKKQIEERIESLKADLKLEQFTGLHDKIIRDIENLKWVLEK